MSTVDPNHNAYLIEIDGEGDLMLVDDDLQFHTIFRYTYQRQTQTDNRLVLVDSGEACIDELRRRCQHAEELPALVLMDVNMPGMSGLQTIAALRDQPPFRKLPVIVMLTSSNFVGDRESALAAGAQGYIEKPFGLDDLQFRRRS